MRRRWGRTITHSRRMSRWSYAFPRTSSSVCGGLDMAPALPPSRLSARWERAASAGETFSLLIGELLLDLLDAPEASVEAAGLEELGVRALLHQPPLVEDDDLVGLLGNAQPMRHGERAASRHCRPKRAEDLGLLARIDRGEDVVEDEDGRLRHERAGERDALPLAAREGETALADHGLPAFGKALDLRAEPRRLRGRAKPHLGCQLIAEGHVVADGAREEESLLRHVAHGAPQARTRKIAHIDSAHEDGAGRRLVETAHQRAQRRLAASRGPDHGDQGALRHGEAHVGQRGLAAV